MTLIELIDEHWVILTVLYIWTTVIAQHICEKWGKK